ncbi:S-formylglutathione hydrolase [Corallococcus sp. Z5C101001]|uniref:S-formylglutathione hydrolase n=1 Tax=Corallococcus sp. Z5C101001 TaxID=2596829 RepID=UPI00117C0227|nr:S-formylglutathione hydrolase [Corallococcus sp. Z5C101001]TSC21655.1 S-formylglutathione hydrolase [Corallococcus sp. Z5C101001]
MSAVAPTLVSEHACFGGTQSFWKHPSEACGGEMRFSVFTPPQAKQGPVPVLYYLAGLTCTEETFPTKGGAQRVAAELGLMLVSPDTSPRGANIPGEDADWDFGTGAGFYLDATQEPWRARYRMGTYITKELPGILGAHFPARMDREGIFGHSMGGHGALVTALRDPGRYRSVSAFAPIVAPIQSPWGKKAFGGYLGPDERAWREYDATELLKSGRRVPALLVDQGTKDKFLPDQLLPHYLKDACAAAGQPLTLRMQEGYDHGYYFISTFMEDHLRHHGAALNAA